MTKEVRDPVREFLESYWETRRDRRVEELTCQCESITSKYGVTPRGGSGRSSVSVWDALIEAKDRVEAKLVESLKLEAAIEDFIDALDNPLHRELLRYRYLEGLSWEDVGEHINRNPDYARRELHGAALQAARKKWREIENFENNC